MNGQVTYCKALTISEAACKARPLHNSEYCFFHDPNSTSTRKAASRKGGVQGRISTLGKYASDVRMDSAKDISSLLGQTINQVRKGEIDPRIANAVGYLAGVLLKVREQSEFEERIAKLELAMQSEMK